ncbi:MAG: Hpt domain-containing protein, partial [Firmicutes bacterium]|nr:Hpt domain-containing protein [Bacillota bacterium]
DDEPLSRLSPKRDKAPAPIPSFAMPGVDAEMGLLRMGGDWDSYLSVLRSYAVSTPTILDKLRDVSAETLTSYTINVHGLKSSSGSIGAEDIRETAAQLEKLAKTGDLDGVTARNEAFCAAVRVVLTGIQAWLETHDAKFVKARKPAPDPDLLLRLKKCCEDYDMDGVNHAIDELESMRYDTETSLVIWLRECIDAMEFGQAAKRLAEYEEGLG